MRATTIHSAAAASPVTASGVVTSTGSGFHEGPERVSSARSSASRPHTTQAWASKASDHGISRESAETAIAAPTSAAARDKSVRRPR